jgi:hypothetical protein
MPSSELLLPFERKRTDVTRCEYTINADLSIRDLARGLSIKGELITYTFESCFHKSHGETISVTF